MGEPKRICPACGENNSYLPCKARNLARLVNFERGLIEIFTENIPCDKCCRELGDLIKPWFLSKSKKVKRLRNREDSPKDSPN